MLLPAFASPPDVTDPSGSIVAWWTEPPGLVMQLVRPTRGTTAMAEWMVGPGFELCMAHYPGLSDLRVILDMRQMTGRSATARSLLLQQAKACAACIGHVVLIPSLHMGPTYVKVVEASAMLLRLAGMRADLEQTVERAIAKYDVHAEMLASQSQTVGRPFASRGL